MRILASILFIIFVSLSAAFVYLYSQVTFDASNIINFKPKLTTQIYDRNGELIANIFDENRIYVKYEDIPPRVIEALVAIEDTSFFEHGGVNPEAITRAIVKDIKAGKLVEGASTLTQQLVKNMVLTREKKLTRKLKEMIISMKLENELTKEQILERYLNHVYLGHGYHGIKTAAKGYFRKELNELTLKEIAILVGLPKAPSTYDPTRHLDLSLSRANNVISRMNALGWISDAEYKAALVEQPVVFDDTLTQNKAPYIVDEVLKEASKRFEDIKTGGYVIETSVDLKVQDMASEALKYGYNEILKRNKDANASILNGAIVVTLPKTGEILALVGGVDYAKSSYNRATQSMRQPGSSFKPFIYQIALDMGYSPMSKAADISRVFNEGSQYEWRPKNYSGGFQGYITLREALRQSRNLATINLLDEIGLDTAYKKLSEMGFKNIPKNLSIALGSFGISPLEFAKFYSMFPNGGEIVEPSLIKRIINYQNLEAVFEPERTFVTEPEQAYLMTDMMKTVVERGTGQSARLNGVQVAGKTGTTNNNIDAWFCGFTPEVEVVVWYGNDDNTPMRKVEGGGRTVAPVFKKFMESYMKEYPLKQKTFIEPEGVFHTAYEGLIEVYTKISPVPKQDAQDTLIKQDDERLIF
ncbi:transglycosylase domain-containing protein [Campylobacter showae]|uniref:Multimodular transpeptidase-transglycosylase n=1 Tax=Campylobacter showae CSUNSWCD TaxID=1244083 RepID=M5IE04_9BACT|nr:PBP1A family penicillin-binding protein [Campylobacter showae]EKU10602.1 Multimodular transpeptidase-transglycosylase [Campylobacter showae CSUNSWCD]